MGINTTKYKNFKVSAQNEILALNNAALTHAWYELKTAVLAMIDKRAPQWPGMPDSALAKRLHEKDLAWNVVQATWGANVPTPDLENPAVLAVYKPVIDAAIKVYSIRMNADKKAIAGEVYKHYNTLAGKTVLKIGG